MWRRRRPLDYIEDLEREIDLAFDRLFAEHSMWDIKNRRLEPLAYLTETENKINVSVDLPFVRKEDIKLNVTEDALVIDAAMRRCVKFERWGTVQRECEFASFHKIVKLPTKVVPKEAKATFKYGVLSVDLPKRISRHKIDIK